MCPLCKQPSLGSVLRYGRPLAKRRLDVAEGKWLAAAARQAAAGQEALARGRAAMAEHVADAGAYMWLWSCPWPRSMTEEEAAGSAVDATS